MNRKDFIQLLGAGMLFPFVTVSGTKKPLKTSTKKIYRNMIRGLQYYDYEYIKSKLKVGIPLRLQREPKNPYDKYAISIWYGEHKLGYVPRLENRAIAGLMDKKESFTTEISKLDDTEDYRRKILFTVYH